MQRRMRSRARRCPPPGEVIGHDVEPIDRCCRIAVSTRQELGGRCRYRRGHESPWHLPAHRGQQRRITAVESGVLPVDVDAVEQTSPARIVEQRATRCSEANGIGCRRGEAARAAGTTERPEHSQLGVLSLELAQLPEQPPRLPSRVGDPVDAVRCVVGDAGLDRRVALGAAAVDYRPERDVQVCESRGRAARRQVARVVAAVGPPCRQVADDAPRPAGHSGRCDGRRRSARRRC